MVRTHYGAYLKHFGYRFIRKDWRFQCPFQKPDVLTVSQYNRLKQQPFLLIYIQYIYLLPSQENFHGAVDRVTILRQRKKALIEGVKCHLIMVSLVIALVQPVVRIFPFILRSVVIPFREDTPRITSYLNARSGFCYTSIWKDWRFQGRFKAGLCSYLACYYPLPC